MKLKLYTVFGFLLAVLFTSCKTASKLYEQGKYDEAVQLAVKKLEKDPNDVKLIEIIQHSYHYAVTDHENAIAADSLSGNELKYEWIYNEYAGLQKMHDAIEKISSISDLIQPVDYTKLLDEYAGLAATVRFDRGMRYMDNGDKRSFRAAYSEFEVALGFKPADAVIQAKDAEAYEASMVNVVILPGVLTGYQYASVNGIGSNFDNSIFNDLKYNTGNRFVRVYSDRDARAQYITPDVIVDLRFSNMNIGNHYDHSSVRDVSKQVVVKQTVYSRDSVVNEYATVKARIITTHRDMHSQGDLYVDARDAHGNYLWSDNITGIHEWSTVFASFTGDERALSDEDKQLINRRRDIVPGDYDIIQTITNRINDQLADHLRYRFKGL